MTVVVGEDLLGAANCLLEIGERQEPLANRTVPGEAGVLDESGTPRREIAHGAVAEPARVRTDIDALRGRELGARLLYPGTEREGITRDFPRIGEVPSPSVESVEVGLLGRV